MEQKTTPNTRQGPLKGLRIVEMAGLGPVPLAGQLLADLGADVIVIDRASKPQTPTDINHRGKRSVVLNLKDEAGRAAALKLIASADVLLEGFRPGVMERLGLGPDDCPDTLIYGRMTGWGQNGPLAARAGHDITYLALTGVLSMLGAAKGPAVPPLNLAADYGGGTMFLLFGVLAAVFERSVSGQGQVVDAAMVDGVPAMMGLLYQMRAEGDWTDHRARNLLDGGAPFYRCYTCKDGKDVAVGALEPQFYAELLTGLGLPLDLAASQMDQSTWQGMHQTFAEIFATRSRDDWAERFAGTDACVAPVLSNDEAAAHPHNKARGTFAERSVHQAVPAPRFSRTPAGSVAMPGARGRDTRAVLQEAGLPPEEIDTLLSACGGTS